MADRLLPGQSGYGLEPPSPAAEEKTRSLPRAGADFLLDVGRIVPETYRSAMEVGRAIEDRPSGWWQRRAKEAEGITDWYKGLSSERAQEIEQKKFFPGVDEQGVTWGDAPAIAMHHIANVVPYLLSGPVAAAVTKTPAAAHKAALAFNIGFGGVDQAGQYNTALRDYWEKTPVEELIRKVPGFGDLHLQYGEEEARNEGYKRAFSPLAAIVNAAAGAGGGLAISHATRGMQRGILPRTAIGTAEGLAAGFTGGAALEYGTQQGLVNVGAQQAIDTDKVLMGGAEAAIPMGGILGGTHAIMGRKVAQATGKKAETPGGGVAMDHAAALANALPGRLQPTPEEPATPGYREYEERQEPPGGRPPRYQPDLEEQYEQQMPPTPGEQRPPYMPPDQRWRTPYRGMLGEPIPPDVQEKFRPPPPEPRVPVEAPDFRERFRPEPPPDWQTPQVGEEPLPPVRQPVPGLEQAQLRLPDQSRQLPTYPSGAPALNEYDATLREYEDTLQSILPPGVLPPRRSPPAPVAPPPAGGVLGTVPRRRRPPPGGEGGGPPPPPAPPAGPAGGAPPAAAPRRAAPKTEKGPLAPSLKPGDVIIDEDGTRIPVIENRATEVVVDLKGKPSVLPHAVAGVITVERAAAPAAEAPAAPAAKAGEARTLTPEQAARRKVVQEGMAKSPYQPGDKVYDEFGDFLTVDNIMFNPRDGSYNYVVTWDTGATALLDKQALDTMVKGGGDYTTASGERKKSAPGRHERAAPAEAKPAASGEDVTAKLNRAISGEAEPVDIGDIPPGLRRVKETADRRKAAKEEAKTEAPKEEAETKPKQEVTGPVKEEAAAAPAKAIPDVDDTTAPDWVPRAKPDDFDKPYAKELRRLIRKEFKGFPDTWEELIKVVRGQSMVDYLRAQIDALQQVGKATVTDLGKVRIGHDADKVIRRLKKQHDREGLIENRVLDAGWVGEDKNALLADAGLAAGPVIGRVDKEGKPIVSKPPVPVTSHLVPAEAQQKLRALGRERPDERPDVIATAERALAVMEKQLAAWREWIPRYLNSDVFNPDRRKEYVFGKDRDEVFFMPSDRAGGAHNPFWSRLVAINMKAKIFRENLQKYKEATSAGQRYTALRTLRTQLKYWAGDESVGPLLASETRRLSNQEISEAFDDIRAKDEDETELRGAEAAEALGLAVRDVAADDDSVGFFGSKLTGPGAIGKGSTEADLVRAVLKDYEEYAASARARGETPLTEEQLRQRLNVTPALMDLREHDPDLADTIEDTLKRVGGAVDPETGDPVRPSLRAAEAEANAERAETGGSAEGVGLMAEKMIAAGILNEEVAVRLTRDSTAQTADWAAEINITLGEQLTDVLRHTAATLHDAASSMRRAAGTGYAPLGDERLALPRTPEGEKAGAGPGRRLTTEEFRARAEDLTRLEAERAARKERGAGELEREPAYIPPREEAERGGGTPQDAAKLDDVAGRLTKLAVSAGSFEGRKAAVARLVAAFDDPNVRKYIPESAEKEIADWLVKHHNSHETLTILSRLVPPKFDVPQARMAPAEGRGDPVLTPITAGAGLSPDDVRARANVTDTGAIPPARPRPDESIIKRIVNYLSKVTKPETYPHEITDDEYVKSSPTRDLTSQMYDRNDPVDVELRKVADQTVGDVPIMVLHPDIYNALMARLKAPENTPGYYDWRTDTIYMNRDAANADTAGKAEAWNQYLRHEVGHAMTFGAIETSPRAQRAITALTDIIRARRNYWGTELKAMAERTGLSAEGVIDRLGNPHEFIQELQANKDFRRVMAAVPLTGAERARLRTPEARTIFEAAKEWIYRAVKNLFSRSGTDNALTDGLAMTFEMLQGTVDVGRRAYRPGKRSWKTGAPGELIGMRSLLERRWSEARNKADDAYQRAKAAEEKGNEALRDTLMGLFERYNREAHGLDLKLSDLEAHADPDAFADVSRLRTGAPGFWDTALGEKLGKSDFGHFVKKKGGTWGQKALWTHTFEDLTRWGSSAFKDHTIPIRQDLSELWTMAHNYARERGDEDMLKAVGEMQQSPNADRVANFLLRESKMQAAYDVPIGQGKNAHIKNRMVDRQTRHIFDRMKAEGEELARDVPGFTEMRRKAHEWGEKVAKDDQLAVINDTAGMDSIVHDANGNIDPLAQSAFTKWVVNHNDTPLTSAEQAWIDGHRPDPKNFTGKAQQDAYLKRINFDKLVASYRDNPDLARRAGPWVPFKRFGDHAISGEYNFPEPTGGRSLGDGSFEFYDEGSANSMIDRVTDGSGVKLKHADRIVYVKDPTKPREQWSEAQKEDVTTWKWEGGKVNEPGYVVTTSEGTRRVSPKQAEGDPAFEIRYRLNFNDRHVEFFRKQREADERLQELKQNPHLRMRENVELVSDYGGSQSPHYMSRAMRGLMDNVRNSWEFKRMTQAERRAWEQRMMSAAAKQVMMAGGRAPGLMREFVEGQSRDLLEGYAMASAQSAFNHAHYTYGQRIRDKFKGLDEFNHQTRYSPGYSDQRAVTEEMERRAYSVQDPFVHGIWGTATNRLLQATYTAKLAGTSFLGLQAMEPWTRGLPVLAAKYGYWRAFKIMAGTYSDLAGWSLIGKGIEDFKKAALNRDGDWADYEKSYAEALRNAKSPNAEEEIRMFDVLARRGMFDRSSANEVTMLRAPKATVGGKILDRIDNSFRGLNTGFEAMNRGVLALTAFRAEKGTFEQRIRAAESAVYQGAGVYASWNAPPIFNHPVVRMAFQFKKYPQGIMSNYIWALVGSMKGDKVALHQLGYMLGTTAMMAGAFGLPTEIFSIPVNALSFLGIGPGWSEIQSEAYKMMANQFGPELAEVLAHGLPRAFNVDLSTRAGQDSLLFFGDPKSNKPQDLKASLASVALGAGGSTLFNTIEGSQYLVKALSEAVSGSSAKANEYAVAGIRDLMVIAQVTNIIDAIRKSGGDLTPRTAGGAALGPELTAGETAMKALGVTSGREARYWEARRTEQAREKSSAESRRVWTDRYATATPSERPRIRAQIDEWNRTHPKADEIKPSELAKAVSRRRTEEARPRTDLALTRNRRYETERAEINRIYNIQ